MCYFHIKMYYIKAGHLGVPFGNLGDAGTRLAKAVWMYGNHTMR